MTTRDVRKVYPGKSVYAAMLNDAGKFTDDCLIFRTGPNSWMTVFGSGTGYEDVAADTVGKNVSILFDDDLQDLSLQGPLAVEISRQARAGHQRLKYFHHMQTTLFGKPVMISRTGYTGERGYEIFCRAEDALEIWDTILEEGKAMGIVPASFTALDWLRVESYLLFYPYDNSQMYPFENEPPGDTLWELGLDFTVSPGKTLLPWRRGALQLEGQGALQDLRARRRHRQGARGRRRALGRRQEGRRRHLRHVFARDEPLARHRAASMSASPSRAPSWRSRARACSARRSPSPINFDDPEKKKRTAA